MDAPEIEAALEDAFGGTEAERRVVARQARDLADSGSPAEDRGHPLSVEELIGELEDAPDDSSLSERWNWWVGALDVAYGGYEEFAIRRLPADEP